MAAAAGAALVLAVPAEAHADNVFGAMAYSPAPTPVPTNDVAWGTGPTQQAAIDAAFNQCTATSGNPGCSLVYLPTNGGCMALVQRTDGEWIGNLGTTKDAAIANARQALGGPPAQQQVVAVQCV
jgi:hypothetical protein